MNYAQTNCQRVQKFYSLNALAGWATDKNGTEYAPKNHAQGFKNIVLVHEGGYGFTVRGTGGQIKEHLSGFEASGNDDEESRFFEALKKHIQS